MYCSNKVLFSLYFPSKRHLYCSIFLSISSHEKYALIFWNQHIFNILGKLFGICSSLTTESFTYFVYLSKESLFCRHFCPGDGHLRDHLVSAQKFILIFYHCLGRHETILISVQGVITIYYFCPGGHNDLLFLSRGSLRFTISVQGVILFFIFVWGVTVDHYACPGGSLAFCHLSWWKDHPNSCPGGTS